MSCFDIRPSFFSITCKGVNLIVTSKYMNAMTWIDWTRKNILMKRLILAKKIKTRHISTQVSNEIFMVKLQTLNNIWPCSVIFTPTKLNTWLYRNNPREQAILSKEKKIEQKHQKFEQRRPKHEFIYNRCIWMHLITYTYKNY